MTYGFDMAQLRANVDRKRREEGLSHKRLGEKIDIAKTNVNRFLGPRPYLDMNSTHFIRYLMYVEDYDIRDYLIEER